MKAKIIPLYSPRERYQMHIARANRFILSKVLTQIQNNNENKQ